MARLLARDEIKKRFIEAMRQNVGPVACAAIEDPEVVEVMLNPDGEIWEDRLGKGMRKIGELDQVSAYSFVASVATFTGTSITRERPTLQAELPMRGARFEALIPPVVASASFCIRLKAVRVFTLDDYVSDGIMTAEQRALIGDAVRSRLNIIVAGGTGGGKTTLVNACLDEIAEGTPDDRIVILEDTVELQCNAPNTVSMRTTDDADMGKLLRSTLRFRPDRIIVGEVRDHTAHSMLKAWNTGHPGGLCTVHANSAREALRRIEQLVSEAIQSDQRPIIAEAVNLIVPIAKVRDSRARQVNPIVRVDGFHNGEYVLTTLES